MSIPSSPVDMPGLNAEAPQRTVHDEAISARVKQVLIGLTGATTRVRARAVAQVMFQEFGEIPSSNRLHGFLSHGSLSTIVDELRLFKLTLNLPLVGEPGMDSVPSLVIAAYRKCLPVLWAAALEKARAEVRASCASASQAIPSKDR